MFSNQSASLVECLTQGDIFWEPQSQSLHVHGTKLWVHFVPRSGALCGWSHRPHWAFGWLLAFPFIPGVVQNVSKTFYFLRIGSDSHK